MFTLLPGVNPGSTTGSVWPRRSMPANGGAPVVQFRTIQDGFRPA